ncbi:hypothetical protein GCM10023191_101750 [Actinoallomurus oryzae]|uniref:Uncharacterized protein n=1 Tax=Actinoallomurus oryzae TaxID=502180 RepID=A0ABP8RAB4_9ACTN
MTADTTSRPETAVATVRQALTAARAAARPNLGQLGEETAGMRRSDLAVLIDEIDATVGLIGEVLTSADSVEDWLPDGQTLLSEALAGLDHTRLALEEIHSGLAPVTSR